MPAAHEPEESGGGGRAQRPGGELGRRIASALVLGVAAIAATVSGGLPFLLFWTAAAFWVWWEWIDVVAAVPRTLLLAIGGVAIAGMAAGLGLDAPAIAFVCAVIGTGVVASAADPKRIWAAGGLLYAAAVLIPPVMLRGDPAAGLAAVFWLFAAVWAADIGAYFAGRHFRGPLLAPSISPNKTWSGTLGGLIAGMAAGSIVVVVAGFGWRAMHLAVALLVVVASQIGDLFESAVKRRFGVKDSSRLIPGHGGLMDRLDGFLVAAAVALILGIARAGADAPATGLLVW